MEALNILNKLSAITKLQEVGGEIFLVGGIVRDHFLKKESKDIDIVVRNVEESVIKEILESCGRLASDDVDGDGKTDLIWNRNSNNAYFDISIKDRVGALSPGQRDYPVE